MNDKKIAEQNTESFGTKGEYHDGGRLSHWGGNDDYKNDNDKEPENDFTGKVAYGNLISNSSLPYSSQPEKKNSV